jgi:enoyl-CoA hydratase/carnithine racemase
MREGEHSRGLYIEGDEVSYEVVDAHIALIRLLRPNKRNAITAAMAKRLEQYAQRAECDEPIRAVVLTGGEEVFCAGADLQEVAAGGGAGLRTRRGGFAGIVDAPRRKPWIAAVAGPIMAGGLEMALACDIIIVGPTALFALPEVRRGLLASGGGVYRLARALPRAVALDMIATGLPITADRALALGLASEMAVQGGVVSAALARARVIAANAPLAVMESLAIARAAPWVPEAESRAKARAVGDRMLASQDAREGARAFLEKRAPVWKSR